MIGLRFYFLRQALLNMRRNLTVHILSLGTIVACLLILGAFLLLFGNLNNWLRQWGSALSMSIYLKDGTSAYKRDKIDSFIRALPGARIRRFISKEEAMHDLKAALGKEAGFLERLTHNPLPASYEVIFENAGTNDIHPEEIKEQLLALDGVEDVQHSRQWLKRLEGFLQVVRLMGYIIGGLLCLCVVFIVTNTIKLTIYSRRDEIEILKLVGATDWFVKLPFLLEGMIQGILGGGLAIVSLFLGYLAFSSKEIYLIGPAPLEFVFLPVEYMVLAFSLSMVLGIIGSFIAIGRFI
ncbi:MAG: permease-like cell division protein FtsX [Candidatus Desulfacyla sp.]